MPGRVPPTILWITNPWEELDHPNDTSLRLMRECLAMGAQTFWADYRTVEWCDGGPFVAAAQARATKRQTFAPSFTLSQTRQCRSGDFRVIVYRVDPPVDDAYRHSLQILWAGVRNAHREQSVIVNAPEVLLGSASKLEVLAVNQFVPATLVSSQWDSLQKFGQSHGSTLLKPLHHCNGSGISRLEWSSPEDTRRSELALRHLTREFTEPVVLQQWLAADELREFRCWFLNGGLLAFARKNNDPLAERASVTSFQPCAMNSREIAVSQAVQRHLRRRRICLAAADLLNGFLIDLNFASPGLIVEMEDALNTNLSIPIVEAILSLPARSRTAPGSATVV
jgi:glutathione synthase